MEPTSSDSAHGSNSSLVTTSRTASIHQETREADDSHDSRENNKNVPKLAPNEVGGGERRKLEDDPYLRMRTQAELLYSFVDGKRNRGPPAVVTDDANGKPSTADSSSSRENNGGSRVRSHGEREGVGRDKSHLVAVRNEFFFMGGSGPEEGLVMFCEVEHMNCNFVCSESGDWSFELANAICLSSNHGRVNHPFFIDYV